MPEDTLHRQNIVACLWDFDKTLIPGYMQWPIFEHFGIDERAFWQEVNGMEEVYRQRGQDPSPEILYLNHLLTYTRAGITGGLNNAMLRKFGQKLKFYDGLPEFFDHLKRLVAEQQLYARYEIKLEHYIISTGLAEMVRGSAIAPYVDGVYACEFIENPLPPYYNLQQELEMEPGDCEIGQIGRFVDNTIKTRFIFEINKGTNKIASIDVNSKIAPEDRRVPIKNMIYIADGPSDVPVFSVVRKNGGKAYAVYAPGSESEFVQNDELRQCGRVDHFGRADFRERSDTYMWLTTHVRRICDRIVEESEQALNRRVGRPPRHLHDDEPRKTPQGPQQEILFG
ncbi:MAG: hypothetical protein E1N59_1089 [Puniceicoccaceae bacterium 5H]|nr:MAG: hypothetical protein E1N59_1089 [Puniceicoccaceae bacterium 5H]